MTKSLLLAGLLASATLLSGCDSQFHPYDGHSGYQINPLGAEQYHLNYIGKPVNSERDVRMMWHHAARERCRGGSYQHQLTIEQKTLDKTSLHLGNTLIPKGEHYIYARGHLHCLAPGYALKKGALQQDTPEQPVSTVEHFATN